MTTTVATAPDETLWRAVVVLRAAGARITRYDGEEGTLEARLARWRRPVLVRLRAVAAAAGSRVTVEGEGWGWRGTARRVLASLAQPGGADS